MPTVLRSGPDRLFFYAGDGEEPPHFHVERDSCEAKFWLDPVRLARSHGFAAKELRTIEKLIIDNQQPSPQHSEVVARVVGLEDGAVFRFVDGVRCEMVCCSIGPSGESRQKYVKLCLAFSSHG